MHHDPLISSRKKPLVSWGHDWVVLTLLIAHPFWAPTKVFALPVAARLYRNRQGLTKGKKKGRTKASKHDPHHRTRPQLAVELIALAASWFPNDQIMVSGDSAYGGKSVLSHLPSNVHLISHIIPSQGALYEPASREESLPAQPKRRGTKTKEASSAESVGAFWLWEAAEWGLEHRDLSKVTALGVDEIAWARGHTYLTLLYDIGGEAKRLLAVAEERKEASLRLVP